MREFGRREALRRTLARSRQPRAHRRGIQTDDKDARASGPQARIASAPKREAAGGRGQCRSGGGASSGQVSRSAGMLAIARGSVTICRPRAEGRWPRDGGSIGRAPSPILEWRLRMGVLLATRRSTRQNAGGPLSRYIGRRSIGRESCEPGSRGLHRSHRPTRCARLHPDSCPQGRAPLDLPLSSPWPTASVRSRFIAGKQVPACTTVGGCQCGCAAWAASIFRWLGRRRRFPRFSTPRPDGSQP